MRDVANKAGVSIQTVSAIINGKPGITHETTARVQSVIKELGYRPYTIARSLRTGQTQTIALIVSDIYNPSFSTIASAAEDVAHSFGYNLIIYNTHDNPEREAIYINKVAQAWMDGVIIAPIGDQTTGLETLRNEAIPAVAIDRIPKGYEGPSVTFNNFKAGQVAARHLLELGHCAMAHISGPMNLHISQERLDGFVAEIDRQCAQPVAVQTGDWTCASGYSAMKSILNGKDRPTAVFTANDRMAIGAMQAICDSGLAVPADISIVGVDDIEVSAFQTPPLTTVRQSFPEMASICVHLLIDLLQRKTPEQTQIVIEPNLVIRKSTRVKKG